MGETVTAGAIAKVLHEKQRCIIARALKVLGPERSTPEERRHIFR